MTDRRDGYGLAPSQGRCLFHADAFRQAVGVPVNDLPAVASRR